jgi:hypothetical protein
MIKYCGDTKLLSLVTLAKSKTDILYIAFFLNKNDYILISTIAILELRENFLKLGICKICEGQN